jgi:hypothetical protein
MSSEGVEVSIRTEERSQFIDTELRLAFENGEQRRV